MILIAGILSCLFSNTVSQVSQNPFLYTSSWYGNASNVAAAQAVTIDIKDCVRNEGFKPVFLTSGLSFLSTTKQMSDESVRLANEKIVFAIGEPNRFLEFIFPLNSTTITKLSMYPNDTELMRVVLSVFERVSIFSNPITNIMIIVNRTKDYSNLAINNFENIIKEVNKQKWLNIIVLEYISAENVIYNLYQQTHFNIISLLQDPLLNRELIEKVFLANLFVYKYRWVIVDLLGGTNDLNKTIFGEGALSNNVTIITFAQPNLDGRSVLLQAAFNVIINDKCSNTPGLPAIETGKFNKYERTTFNFSIYQNPGKKRVKIGEVEYNRLTGNVTLPNQLTAINFQLNEATSRQSIQNAGFTIGFVERPPFSFRDGTTYSGFSIELLTNILKDFNITPNIVPLNQAQIGSYNSITRRYNGMLGNLQNGTVDTISLPIILTINKLNFFDFSTNVLSGSIAGMYKTPSKVGLDSLIDYTKSFDWKVWVTLFGCAVATAIALTITDSFQPDKYARYKLLMSGFFSISSLTHGAYFDPPRRVGGRIIMCFWWLFCLLVVVIWATNYAALLAKEKTEQQLTDFFSILGQTKYRYITVNDNVVFAYLVNNPYPKPQATYRIMNEETVNGTVESINDAISLVQEGNVVFLYDDKTLSYYSYQRCYTTFGKFISFDYGFAFPKFSEKTVAINNKLAQRVANNYTSSLIKKYWPSYNPNCTSSDIIDKIANTLQPIIPDTFRGSLNINVMIGVFTIVVLGTVCSLVLAVVEKIIRILILKSQQKRDIYRYETTVEQLTSF